MERSDLHIHYDPRDRQSAARTAREAIDIANQINVRAISLLARSQIVEEYKEFIEYGKERNVLVIPGIEHKTVLEGTNIDIDLICLGFDHRHHEIQSHFGTGEQSKLAKIARIQRNFLESMGFNFDNLSSEDQELIKTIMAGKIVEKAVYLCEIASNLEQNQNLLEQLKNKNIDLWYQVKKDYFDKPNYVNNTRKQWGKFLYYLLFDVGCPGFEIIMDKVKQKGSAEKTLAAVHAAGGVVLYSPEGRFDKNLWQKLQDLGIDGIMGWHGGRLGYNKVGRDIPSEIIKSAVKQGLLVLGGSDYQQGDWALGSGNGEFQMSIRRSKDLLDYIKSKNNGHIPWQ